MARRAPLRTLCVVATAAVARGFLSPSCGRHCGGSASSFAATAASATHVARPRCTSSAWRPTAAPARTRRLGDLRMVSHIHNVHVVVLFLSFCPDVTKHNYFMILSICISCHGTSATAENSSSSSSSRQAVAIVVWPSADTPPTLHAPFLLVCV